MYQLEASCVSFVKAYLYVLFGVFYVCVNINRPHLHCQCSQLVIILLRAFTNACKYATTQ